MEKLTQSFYERDTRRCICELELSCSYAVENWRIKKSSKNINYYNL